MNYFKQQAIRDFYSQKQKPLAMLPNKKGFKFKAILKTGEIVDTEVKRTKDGLHYFDEYKQSISWI